MIRYGLFTTNPGKNVLSATNKPLDYSFNSLFNTFKIYKEVGGSISVPAGGTGTTRFYHSLGYKPALLAYYRLKKSSGLWFSDMTSLNTNDPDNDGYKINDTLISNDSIYGEVVDSVSSGATDVEYKWFILTNPIDLVSSTARGINISPDYGLKVSIEGKSVILAKPHELLTSSKYPNLVFHKEITLSFTIGAGQSAGSASYSHGLGYVPMFVGTIVDYNNSAQQRLAPFGRVPQPIGASIKANREVVTATAVQLPNGAQTYYYRIIILKNRLAVA